MTTCFPHKKNRKSKLEFIVPTFEESAKYVCLLRLQPLQIFRRPELDKNNSGSTVQILPPNREEKISIFHKLNLKTA